MGSLQREDIKITQKQNMGYIRNRNKFKIRQMIGSRPLLLHLMLKQGETWYPLSSIEMMEIEDNQPESIEVCIGPLANMIYLNNLFT